ncbi:hypothetical protein Tco_0859010 [Tanacetum coccineum]|uniref:Uncharacterized protein n=1 Tax=Tanacetum coccineum TaxID=301880 RepID=A0ABQ5BDR5_9ASTR
MDDNQLNEADLVVDARNLLIETEIQDMDGLNVDTDAKENLVAAPVEKPKQNHVNNPQGAINKGDRRGEHRKSGREIALKAKTKQSQKCLYYGEKTNKHTKITCLLNPKYVAKLARITTAAEQGAIPTAATVQAARTAATIEQATNAF